MDDAEALLLVTTTCAQSADADRMARAALEAKLAACAQILPIRSLYWWKGAIQDETEWLLLLKTRRSEQPRLEAMLTKFHPYETPEILTIDVMRANASYLSWITSTLTRPEMG